LIFSSLEFFAFLAVVLAAIRLIASDAVRRVTLLIASYVFYAWWDWRFCFLLLGSTAVDYMIGLALERAVRVRLRRLLLTTSLVANLGVLAVFKYADFFAESVNSVARDLGISIPPLGLVLPVGISFFTFQTMSYSIDVYRGNLRATRSFLDFALFVSFFPQLVAGPIVRGSEFLPQLGTGARVTRTGLRAGAELFLRGFVKKVLFADTLAVLADPVFADPAAYSGGTCWLATLAYTGQIYYDFSGYSDMAIGVGGMLGFNFPENFRHPYLSRNITEFWRRWHMSLSRWLRDYLYVPLGGNRRGATRTYVNLFLTMLLGGLWHGASWTFVLWGAWHGVGLAVHRLWRGREREAAVIGFSPSAVLSWASTLLFVMLGWILFRCQTMADAATMVVKMAGVSGGTRWYHVESIVVLLLAVGLHAWTLARGEYAVRVRLDRAWGWALAAAAAIAVLLYAPFGTNPFIYFQF